jgi:hypothetical protein
MKVIGAGTLVFIPGRAVTCAGWHFCLQPGEVDHGEDTKPGRRAQLLAALAHIAEVSGVDLEPESVTPAPERVLTVWRRQDIAAERQVAEAIEKARR